MTEPKKSDLPVRAASAVVMVAVAGTALWLGGWVWTAFVVMVALGVLWEWTKLARVIAPSYASFLAWELGAAFYIGPAAAMLIYLRNHSENPAMLLAVVAAVIATDVGAFFAGRTFGGPKIAPKISPSKTWSGLLGGALGAGIALYLTVPGLCYDNCPTNLDQIMIETVQRSLSHFAWADLIVMAVIGAIVAITAQTGDFFESWMKRRAGVKDSGNLIPGHGGLFDRVDGLLAVCFVLGLFTLPGLLTGQ